MQAQNLVNVGRNVQLNCCLIENQDLNMPVYGKLYECADVTVPLLRTTDKSLTAQIQEQAKSEPPRPDDTIQDGSRLLTLRESDVKELYCLRLSPSMESSEGS